MSRNTLDPNDPKLQRRTFNQMKAWQKYRKLLAHSARTRGVVIDRIMWNGIRNAWFDGYWTCYERNKELFVMRDGSSIVAKVMPR